jgi:hypothetical protein
MPLPDRDSLANAGGALLDYSPTIDPTRERPATAENAGFADSTSATATVARVCARIQSSGASNPAFLFHDEVWNNGANVAPTLQRVSAGHWAIIYASGASGGVVVDELGNNHTVNLVSAVVTPENIPYLACIGCSMPNVLGLSFYTAIGASVAVDPVSGAIFNVLGR